MKKLGLFFLICFRAAQADICSSETGNLIQNCGFETALSHWTIGGNMPGGAPNNQFYGVDSLNPNSGANEAYFGVPSSPITLQQANIPTSPGTVYAILFHLAQDTPTSPGYTNAFSVTFDGSFVNFGAIPAGGYATYGFGAVATSALSTLTFSLQNDAGYFSLDDVSITLAPEPSVWFGIALLVFILARRNAHSRE